MSFGSFDISASGLYAQRVRMDTISSNIANINTTRNPDGSPEPYVRKKAVFSAIYDDKLNNPKFPSGGIIPEFSSGSGNMMLKGNITFEESNVAKGVTVNQVEEDKNPYKMVFDPSHPDSNDDGFVKMPNINIVTEMVDMMTASRAYEANVTSIQATKSMINSAMKI